MDGAANPYLLQAGVLAAGLDGARQPRAIPASAWTSDMYTEGPHGEERQEAPLNLLDALRATDKSKVLRSAFGDTVIDSYLKLPHGRLEQLLPPPHPVGTGAHAGLLKAAAGP
mgnify:CR=1 FL=1